MFLVICSVFRITSSVLGKLGGLGWASRSLPSGPRPLRCLAFLMSLPKGTCCSPRLAPLGPRLLHALPGRTERNPSALWLKPACEDHKAVLQGQPTNYRGSQTLKHRPLPCLVQLQSRAGVVVIPLGQAALFLQPGHLGGKTMGKTERRSHHPARGSQALFLPSQAASLFPQREMAAKSCLLPSKHSQGGWEKPPRPPPENPPILWAGGVWRPDSAEGLGAA